MVPDAFLVATRDANIRDIVLQPSPPSQSLKGLSMYMHHSYAKGRRDVELLPFQGPLLGTR